MEFDVLSDKVIGCAIEVHKELGPGLFEKVYQQCMALELSNQGINFESEKPIGIHYKGTEIQYAYRLDLLIDNQIIVELKCVDKLTSLHEAQLLTYLKLTGLKTGLLINFNVPLLKQGLVRRVL
jgi:GxxExxY protein